MSEGGFRPEISKLESNKEQETIMIASEIVSNALNELQDDDFVTALHGPETHEDLFNDQSLQRSPEDFLEYISPGGRYYGDRVNVLKKHEGLLEAVEEQLLNRLRMGEPLSISMMLLIADLADVKGVLLNEELADFLEHDALVVSDLYPLIQEILRSDHPSLTYTAHRIIDFEEALHITLQNICVKEFQSGQFGREGSIFTTSAYLSSLIVSEHSSARNFFIQEHCADVFHVKNLISSDKPGAITEMAGGSSDSIVYAYANVSESFKNRGNLGLMGGDCIYNSVHKLSPNHYGLYFGGKLEAVFDSPYDDVVEQFNQAQQYLIDLNIKEYEYIYDSLNETDDKSVSSERKVLTFLKSVYDSGQNFYFDTSRLREENLPPYVLGLIYQHNEEYLQNAFYSEDLPMALGDQEFNESLFPFGGSSPNLLYEYEYFVSLGMRQRLEQGLGIKLEELDLPIQRNLLLYLSRAETQEVRQDFKGYIQRWGKLGLNTMLCLENNNITTQDREKLFSLGTNEDENIDHTTKVLLVFSEIVETAMQARQYLINKFPTTPNHSKIAEKASQSMLNKAVNILLNYVNSLGDTEVLVGLNKIKTDVLLFTTVFEAAFSEVQNSEQKLELSDFDGLSLDGLTSAELLEADKNEILNIYIENRQNSAEYSEELLNTLTNELRELLNSPNGTWYILRHNNQIIAFNRIEERPDLGEKHVVASSFNVRKDHQGSAIGQAHAQATRDSYLSRGFTLHGIASPHNFEYWKTMGAQDDGPDLAHPGFRKIITTPESWAKMRRQKLDTKKGV